MLFILMIYEICWLLQQPMPHNMLLMGCYAGRVWLQDAQHTHIALCRLLVRVKLTAAARLDVEECIVLS